MHYISRNINFKVSHACTCHHNIDCVKILINKYNITKDYIINHDTILRDLCYTSDTDMFVFLIDTYDISKDSIINFHDENINILTNCIYYGNYNLIEILIRKYNLKKKDFMFKKSIDGISALNYCIYTENNKHEFFRCKKLFNDKMYMDDLDEIIYDMQTIIH